MHGERVLTQADYERLGERLYHELVALRERAKLLPYGDNERWELSIRADEIGKELTIITDKSRRP